LEPANIIGDEHQAFAFGTHMSSDQHVVRAARHANPSQLGPYLPEMRRGFRPKC
jgi:hypothetical protein